MELPDSPDGIVLHAKEDGETLFQMISLLPEIPTGPEAGFFCPFSLESDVFDAIVTYCYRGRAHWNTISAMMFFVPSACWRSW